MGCGPTEAAIATSEEALSPSREEIREQLRAEL
jgi:hypothetical protein